MTERGSEEQEEIELEQHIIGAKREIYEMASERRPEKIKELITNIRGILEKEREKGKGFLADNKKISEIENGPYGSEYFVDGKVAYLPRRGEGIFIGDIHGDSEAVISAVEQSGFIEGMERGDQEKVLIFEGDYANRGEDSIGALGLVLKLKERYPENVILMRGNHEGMDQSMLGTIYGYNCLFKSILKEVYPRREHNNRVKGLELLSEYVDLFKELPGIVLTASGIAAVHGGIPNKGVDTLRQLNNERILEQMRWNDPGFKSAETIPNIDREPEKKDKPEEAEFVEFGEGAFKKFMSQIGARVMLRSHEPKENGADIIFNNQLVTIFSSGGNNSKLSHYKNKVETPKMAIVNLEEDKEKWEEDDFREIEYIKPNL